MDSILILRTNTLNHKGDTGEMGGKDACDRHAYQFGGPVFPCRTAVLKKA